MVGARLQATSRMEGRSLGALCLLMLPAAGAGTPPSVAIDAGLMAYSLRVALPAGKGRRRLESAATSGLERVVDGTWECVYPDGDCYSNHARLEVLPENLGNCSTETNISPTILNITIDLQCSGLSEGIDCGSLEARPYDPFKRCNSDSNLVKATCSMNCAPGRPHQVCIFEFDTSGKYNMSDEAVEVCSFEAACKSKYVESNHMLCSGRKTVAGFKPHWVKGDHPWSQRSNQKLAGPQQKMQEAPAPREAPNHSRMMWEAALLLVASAAVIALARWTSITDPELWKEFIEWLGPKPMREWHIGAKPYKAPPLTGRRQRYAPTRQADLEMSESSRRPYESPTPLGL